MTALTNVQPCPFDDAAVSGPSGSTPADVPVSGRSGSTPADVPVSGRSGSQPADGALPPVTNTAKPIEGEIRFVSAEERTGLHGAITPRGLLAVEITDPPWFPSVRFPDVPAGGASAARRGKLRDAIEWAIESALEMNGAPPAGMSDVGDLDEDLSDQLYRARSIGARGLALYFPHLAAVGSLSGALDAEDSAVLRWWMAATGERPIVVLLDSENRGIGAYGPPTRLERLVEAARRADRNVEPVGSPEVATAQSELAPAAGETEDTLEIAVPVEVAGAAPVAVEVAGAAPVAVEVAVVVPVAIEVAAEAAAPVSVLVPIEAAAPVEVEAAVAVAASVPAELPIVVANDLDEKGDARVQGRPRETGPPGGASASKRLFAERIVPLFPRREVLPAKSPAFIEKGRAVEASLDWRGFANELEVARGPKPLTIVERLFMSRYVPLVDAIERGEADEAARRTAERWAENFARSYTEAFGALKITGKRPRMVLDAPQLCSQIARLHGAKSTHLVLVDAMRFDLGVRVHDRMRDALTAQATCTERLLLWSALPTITPTQLELLARGPEAIASRLAPVEREEPGLRGRTSATLRRIKVGGRDLLKLDVVESRLRESGPPLAERLDAIAEEVAVAVSAHARSLPARSLMFVFGDHGFRMDSCEGGTLAGISGGASPEEVLVPAFAWLIGDVH